MVVGCESSESGNLSSLDGAEFGDFREQLLGGDFSDARHAGENRGLGGPIVTGIKEFRDGLFERCELFVEEGEGLLDGLVRNDSVRGVLSVFLDGLQMDDLSSSGDEILQLLLVFRGFVGEFGFDQFGELGEVTGINGVGLGSMPESFGKVACLSRIDDGDGNVGLNELADEGSFVSSGSLDDEELKCRELFEMHDELLESLEVICQRPCFREWSNMNVELVLGNIDANKYGRSHGCDRSSHGRRSNHGRNRDGFYPVLQMRTRNNGIRSPVHAAVRAGTNGDTAIMLCDGVLIT